MVNKIRNQVTREEPAPVDEAWWESVLAEDESRAEQPRHEQQRRPLANPGGESFTTSIYGERHERGAYTHPGPRSNCLDPIIVDWEQACRLYEQDEKVCLKVTGYNRGGLLVNGEGMQGFVPISHLVEMLPEEGEAEEWLGAYVDRTLLLKVIECDQERGRVVFSERAALAETGVRNQLLQVLKPGDRTVGVVTNITEFGVFVDLGGVEGLVHVSEISWGRVHHPAEIVKLGQRLDVYVIHVDKDRARVALSMKRLYPNPWETAETRYAAGQVADAVVTSIVNFGAFARLEEGLDGLIHISEFNNDGSSVDPNHFLVEGQQIQVRILHVDSARQRLGLSLKLDNNL